MTVRRFGIVSLVASAALLGCGAGSDATPAASTQSAPDLQHEVTEARPTLAEIQLVEAANSADQATLTEAGIDPVQIAKLMEFRSGPDGALLTDDDRDFQTANELRALLAEDTGT